MKPYKFSKDFVNLIFREFMATFFIINQIQRLIKDIISDWKKFVNEDDEYKNQFYFPRARERGWIIKKDKKKSAKKDKKTQFFYFHKDFRFRLESASIDYSKYKTMIINLEKLYEFCFNVSLDVAEQLDKRLTGRSITAKIKECNTKKISKHVITLSYYPKNQNQFSQPRYQKSAWTFCLYQNTLGLYLGTDIDIRHEKKKNTILFLCGADLERLVPGSISMMRSAFISDKSIEHFFVDFNAQTSSCEKITEEYIKKREKQQGFY